MLKTSITESAKPKKGGVGVGSGSRAGRVKNEINRSRIDNIEIDGGKVGDDEVGKKSQKTSKSKNLSKSKKIVGSDGLTPRARLAFTKLRQVFVKALILHHFDPDCHIRIEMDALSYAISGVLNQLTFDDLGRWYSVAFFSHKIIPAETWYKMHNSELLAIIEAFKI